MLKVIDNLAWNTWQILPFGQNTLVKGKHDCPLLPVGHAGSVFRCGPCGVGVQMEVLLLPVGHAG